MDIKAKVFKRKSGKSKGKWIARVEYSNELTGISGTMERTKSKRSEAIDERDRLINDIKKTHGQIQAGERMTFAALADLCSKKFYRPAVIIDGRKEEGVRSYESVQSYLTVLKDYFGKKRIGQITVDSLREYRRWRLELGSRQRPVRESGRFVPVKSATVNRELTVMRRLMRYAYAEGWVTKDIFFNSHVINTSAEIERRRVLTPDEETRLLAACEGQRAVTYERTRRGKKETITTQVRAENPHLKAMILLAIDAGLRRGEILKLRWQDIDFEGHSIHIVGTHTKTERERVVPLTDRAKVELIRVREFSNGDRPFPFTEFKSSWATAKRVAGINDLRFHDLRRTAVTRWQALGIPLAQASKIAGHTQLSTTLKHYIAADCELVSELTDRMNQNNSGPEAKAASTASAG